MKENYETKPNRKKGDLVVLSASRRTDMSQWYADDLIKQLEKYPPEQVHTIVLWTKFSRSILREPLKSKLGQYKQIFINLTITGLGGTPIEKNVPTYKDNLKALPELIEFIGSPKRIRLRIDPICMLEKDGKLITNSVIIKEIVKECSSMGITDFVTSFLVPYGKALERIEKMGYKNKTITDKQKLDYFKKLKMFINEHNGKLYACNVEGLDPSECIDGNLLQELHPNKENCSIFEPKTRPRCGCTHSIDLAYYTTHICKSGCLYCYANTTF